MIPPLAVPCLVEQLLLLGFLSLLRLLILFSAAGVQVQFAEHHVILELERLLLDDLLDLGNRLFLIVLRDVTERELLADV